MKMIIKKVYLVTKTHLDLGYTDLAANILKQYIDSFIPEAIRIAKELNTENKKFVWTTGSWILNTALKKGTPLQVKSLFEAMKRGDIVAHALPFTTHTELMDEDTFRYGLDIIKKLDKQFGRNTVSAKMTDVPGHTIAMVPILREYGIKMLHIGVNESSAVPDVPDIFLWRFKDSEIVVVYNKSYGGNFSCEGIESMVAFCHTSDNCGPVNLEQAKKNYDHYKELYPEAEIIASGLDEIANDLWEIRDTLPVITSEIGDSWIHGSTTDPYKAASLRELMGLKSKWLEEGSLKRDSQEYEDFSDAILCLAEHTNGGDVKIMLSDYTNYLKEDFLKAKEKDIVENSVEALNAEEKIAARIISDIKEKEKPLAYSRIEGTWKEQREYISLSLSKLTNTHKEEAEKVLSSLIPNASFDSSLDKPCNNIVTGTFSLSDYLLTLNDNGGITLSKQGKIILSSPEKGSLIEYVSHNIEDVNEFFETYNRPEVRGVNWAYGDFGRPAFSLTKDKFPSGRFHYVIKSLKESKDSVIISLSTEKEISSKLGAPRDIQVKFSVQQEKFLIEMIWTGKDPNRIQEETIFRLYPLTDNRSIHFKKLGSYINPYDIVYNGNRNCSAVMDVKFSNSKGSYKIKSVHSPLVSLGKGKIMRFDNNYEDVKKDGISFILHNNIWGTNFPLWYSDNAYFRFEISPE